MTTRIDNLKDMYLSELNDMYNGCSKMREAALKSRQKAGSDELKAHIDENIDGMDRTLEMLSSIVEKRGGTVDDTPNKALSAMGEEARAQAIEPSFATAELNDIAIIAKWRQMVG